MSEVNAENSNKKKGLGRGLGSLLGGGDAAEGMASKTRADNVDTHLNTQNRPIQNFTGSAAAVKPSSAASSQPAAGNAPINTEGKVWQVAIDKLASGEFQPRQHFEKESLQGLAQSIKENGILSPIIARKIGRAHV